jgi:hypothetical protein
MTFQKGQPGGPGRPRGARSRLNLLLDQLAEDNVQEILNKVIAAAREGDRHAQNMILKRLWQAPKGRGVEVELPTIENPDDLLAAHGALSAAIAAGDLTAGEAGELAQVLEGHRRAFELLDHEKRIMALQALRKQRESGTMSFPSNWEAPTS